ncbi:hypothetical protein EDD17DRAFT_1636105 [Pisolithus thermaeus]|nr:hypothetical protein EDD17DRAFT_1636105 [Pisolithus thermaeus]
MDTLFPAARALFLVFAAINLKSMLWRLTSCSIVVALLAADTMVTRTRRRAVDYLFGVTLGATVLQSVRFLLLVRPLEEYRHESDKAPAY